jgi:hypothetical protein
MKLIDAVYNVYSQVVATVGDKAYDADGNEVVYDKDVVENYIKANQYKELRAKEYPSYADQFDTIFHEGLDAWKAQIQAVKDKYPKVK